MLSGRHHGRVLPVPAQNVCQEPAGWCSGPDDMEISTRYIGMMKSENRLR